LKSPFGEGFSQARIATINFCVFSIMQAPYKRVRGSAYGNKLTLKHGNCTWLKHMHITHKCNKDSMIKSTEINITSRVKALSDQLYIADWTVT